MHNWGLLCKTTSKYWTTSISVMVSLWILNTYKWDNFLGFSCDWIGESLPLHKHFQFSLVYCGSDWKLNSTVLTFFALIIILVLAWHNVNSFWIILSQILLSTVLQNLVLWSILFCSWEWNNFAPLSFNSLPFSILSPNRNSCQWVPVQPWTTWIPYEDQEGWGSSFPCIPCMPGCQWGGWQHGCWKIASS